MSRRVYVGNLSYNTTTESLKEAFASSGEVVFARVMSDRETGQSRGFGFVEFSTEDQAQKAISDWNGSDLDGRRLRVSVAEDRKNNGPAPAPKSFSSPSGRPVDVYQSRPSSGRGNGGPKGRVPSGDDGPGRRNSGGGRNRRHEDDSDDYDGKWR